MPTGYTYAVANGDVTELRDFALMCARGMGALIMMRDDPRDALIPERFEPSDYNAKRLAEAKAERDRLYALSDTEAEAEAQAEYRKKLAAKEAWIAEKAAVRARYDAMIAQVEQWQKSPDGLKSFMLEQLRSGRDFDCPESNWYYDEPQLLTGPEWRRGEIEKACHDIEYHAVEDAKERERTEGRNVWIAQLRASLPSPTPQGDAQPIDSAANKAAAEGGGE